jgi:hypothetical protein
MRDIFTYAWWFRYRYLWGLIFLDLVIVLLHMLFGQYSSYFNLDHEYNLPTVYQSLKLLTAGHLALGLLWLRRTFGVMSRSELWFYAPLGAMLIFIGLDELGQLHENVDYFVREVSPGFADSLLMRLESVGYYSSTWIAYYSPLIIPAIPYFGFALSYTYRNLRKYTGLFAAIVVCFAGVIFFEFISNQGSIPDHEYQNYIVIEELLEMIGASLAVGFLWQVLSESKREILAQRNIKSD